MPSPAKKPALAQPDWRNRTPATYAPETRWGKRIGLTLLLLALTAVLTWLLWPTFNPDTHLVYLPVLDHDVPIAPIPFSAENVEKFRELASAPHTLLDDCDHLQTSETIQTLAKHLQSLAVRPHSAAIIYISAHGISDNGVGYLLCSDFLRGGPGDDPNVGRYEVSKLLRQVQQCQAQTKLLVLDIGPTITDPRLGMVVNEFPRLLESELRSIPDPQLWVLLSHRGLERSHISFVGKRSVFCGYLLAGLAGDADTPRTDAPPSGGGDKVIELPELFDYVRVNTAAWIAQKTGHTESQRPVLLRGGQGLVDEPPPSLFLYQPVLKKASPESRNTPAGSPDAKTSPAPDAAAANQPASGTPRSAESAEKSAASPAQVTAEGQAKTPASGAPGSETASADRPDGKANPQSASPASAPDAKAKTAAKAQPAGEKPGAPVTPAAPAETSPPAAPKPLVAAEPLPPEGDPNRIRKLLERAWQLRDALRDRNANSWTPVDFAPHLWREYQELLLGFEWRYRCGVVLKTEQKAVLEDLAALTPREVWEETSSRSGQGEATVLRRLANARRHFFESPIPASFRDLPEDLQVVEQAVKLRNDLLFAAPYYVRSHRQIAITSPTTVPLYSFLVQLLKKELPEFVNLLEAFEEPLHTPVQYLRTRLPDLAKMKQGLEARRMMLEFGAQGLQRDVAEVLLVEGRQPIVNRLEALLSTPYFDAAHRLRLLDSLRRTDRMPTLPAAEERNAADREPSSLNQHRWERLAEQAMLEVLLVRLGDPSRSIAVDPDSLLPPHSVQGESRLWEEYRRLGHELGAFYQAIPSQIQRSYNSSDAGDVQRASRLLRLVDGRDVRARLKEEVSAAALRLMPLRTLIPTLVKPVSPVSPVTAEKPRPDVVEMAIERVIDLLGNTVEDQRPARTSRPNNTQVSCLVFPQRPTEFVYRLTNRSGREKKVSVELLTQPEIVRTLPELPPVVDRQGQTLPAFRLLASAVDVKLPADDTPVIVSMAAGKPAPKKDPEPKPAPEKPDAKTVPAPKPLISAGLVCVVRDITEKTIRRDPWVTWIDFVPVAPRQYLTPVVKYGQNRITVELKTARPDQAQKKPDAKVIPLPLLTPDGPPIRVTWETMGREELPDPNARTKTSANLTTLEQEDTLFAEVPQGYNRIVPVRLTVDGCPRAFVYHVRCDRPGTFETSSDPFLARILSPDNGKAFRAPLEQPLSVAVAVDAPTDAFVVRRDDFFEVWLEASELPVMRRLRFHADRQVDIYLQEVDLQGHLKIDTQVHDFLVQLDPGNLRNAEITIRAQLTLAGRPTKPDAKRIVLDGSPPEVLRVETPRLPVDPGADAEITIEAHDSGSKVKTIEYGLDLNNSDTLDSNEKNELHAPNTDGLQKVTIPTKDLKPGRKYRLIVRAIDNVDNPPRELKNQFIEIAPVKAKPAPAEEKPANTPSSIRGQAVGGGGTWVSLKVTIEGPVVRTADGDAEGRFTFTDIPQGTYKLSASAISGNRFLNGETTVNVTAEPAKPQVLMK